MAKRKPNPKAEAPLQPLLKMSDALWLIASITLLLTAYQLWSPDSAVSDAQILGLAITLSAIAVSYRFLSNQRRAKREK